MKGLLLMSWMACGGGPDPARRYAEAAALAPSDPDAALAICQDLPASMVDECQSLTAHAAAPHRPAWSAARCAELRSPFWQDECWFLLAEAQAAGAGGGTPESAARTCDQAGRFQDNCFDHIWRAHASRLLLTLDPAEAAEAYGPAEAWDAAAPGGQAQGAGQHSGRFWQKFYDAPLHDPALPPLDPAWCDSMAPAQARRCKQALPAAFRHTLVRLTREQATQGRALDRGQACDPQQPLSARTQAAFDLRYVAHPELDEIAGRELGRLCAAAGGPPPR